MSGNLVAAYWKIQPCTWEGRGTVRIGPLSAPPRKASGQATIAAPFSPPTNSNPAVATLQTKKPAGASAATARCVRLGFRRRTPRNSRSASTS